MKISKLLVIAGMSALPALALAQATPDPATDEPKAKAGAPAKGQAGTTTKGAPAGDVGAGATTGAGAASGTAAKGERAPTGTPGEPAARKGEAR